MSAIAKLVDLAEAAGLRGELTRWSEADVWWFDARMPPPIKDAGAADSSLRYFETEGDPHNRADAGFIDDKGKIAISFARND
jgi:hypothetical protein